MDADELSYRRVFRAPRELVWRCLTVPEELAQFWGPRGMATPLDGIVVELRPGGRFETLMVGEGGNYLTSLDKLDEHLRRSTEKGRP